MTREEVLQIYTLFSEAYDMKVSDIVIEVWYQVLKVHSFEDGQEAAVKYLRTQHFKPVPADINNLIMDKYIAKTAKPKAMTSLEAWALVYKAICKSGYNSVEEFNKLPDDCKRAIGSPENLEEMARMDVKTVQSVEQSHFIRNYDSIVKRHEQDYQLRIEQVKRGEIPIGQLTTESGYLTDTSALTG